ncbi:MAG: thioredoxin fold domain-containing protein [Arenicellales bacterium]
MATYPSHAEDTAFEFGFDFDADSGFDISDIDDTARGIFNTHPKWFSETFLNLPDDLAEAQADNKKGIIVYYGQKHCAYCEALLEVNFEKEQDIVRYTQANFNVISLDIWGDRDVTDFDGNIISEKDLAEMENTNFTPSLVFYVEDGKEALRLRGYYPPYKFRGALKYVAEGYYKNESYREYLARANPPPKFDLEDLNEQDFFESPPYALDRSRFSAQQPLAIFFERRACHACDILHSEPLEDAKTRALMAQFNVVQLDMWSDETVLTPAGNRTTAEEWARELDVFYSPTIVFFDEKGREVFRIDSVVRLYRLQGVLEYVLAKGYDTTPTYQRWRENQQNSQN